MSSSNHQNLYFACSLLVCDYEPLLHLGLVLDVSHALVLGLLVGYRHPLALVLLGGDLVSFSV